MEKNYQFRNSIYLLVDKYELDLHNDYDFTRLNYSVEERTAELHWKRSCRDWVKSDLPTAAILVFYGISRFEFKPRDGDLPFTEDDCLSTMGYLSNEVGCEEIFWTEEAPENEWMHAFEFMSGAVIVLQAEKSSATIKP